MRGDPGPPSIPAGGRHGLPPRRLAGVPRPRAGPVLPPQTRDPTPDGPAQPPPHAAAQRFVGMCVEILNGYRPAAHLRRVTHPKHCSAVTDQLIRRTVRVRMPPSHAARQGHLVRVRRMLVNEPLPGVAELVAVLEQGPAVWAMAVRLERTARPSSSPGPPTWLCTLVQVV
ncbi:Rv3235 family protein [Dactylosporangium cerinum]